MKSRGLVESSRNAVDGLLHVLRQDWHMTFICLMGAVAMLVSVLLRVPRVEVFILLISLSMVVLAEIVNRAIEVVVDLASPAYHPLAKIAKDLGGAAVLSSVIFATVVALGIFVNADVLAVIQGPGTRPEPHFLHVSLVGVVTLVVAIILGKLWGGHGSLTRGGMVSAHSALAFFCFVSVWYLSPDALVRVLTLLLALFVAQSRVDARIHSIREVVIGMVVALVIGASLYGFLAMRSGG